MKRLQYIFVFLFLMGCRGSNKELKAKFDDIIESSNKQSNNPIYEFSLDSLTDFEWDEAYILPGNTSGIGLDYISDNIGTEWDGTDVEDNYIRMMFLNKKEVVSYIDFDRRDYNIWISGCEVSPHVKPTQAVARVIRGKDDRFISYLHCNGDSKTRYFSPKRCFDKTTEMVKNCE